MQKIDSSNSSYHYIAYQLPDELPVLLLPEPDLFTAVSAKEACVYHNCSELIICHHPMQILIDGNTYEMLPGDVCIIAPFQMHRIVSDSTAEDTCSRLALDHRAALLDFFTETYSFQGPMEQLIKQKRNLMKTADMPRITQLTFSLISQFQSISQPDPYIVKGLLLAFWIELCRAINLTTDNYQMMFKRRELFDVHPALLYIQEYFQQQIPTEKLAQLCNMSPSQFRVIFKNRLHQTPHEYINSMRLSYACRLLLETDLNILPISISCGFNSLSSFNRCFKEKYGTSPTQWKVEH